MPAEAGDAAEAVNVTGMHRQSVHAEAVNACRGSRCIVHRMPGGESFISMRHANAVDACRGGNCKQMQ